ncbi:MAG: hypothetical protein QGH42_11200 [Kiritimatiellia bacterium]|jgi:hypothetical protein|nr:hypothetical protein [Kiritimatiellia bacterium]MDP6631063.1 hypothetical protein [Kiritimatiellia bacterium]MDP6810019.1 hypothetical protein [Kiritimatiellia bacterium]MDP7024790.1 hypothetical protein [Kiritimatiellia bacterium]
MRKSTVWLVLVALCSGICVTDAVACTKPVFRYALERWRAAPYGLAVLHKGELDRAARDEISSIVPEDAYNWSVAYGNVDGELPAGVIKAAWDANPDAARLPLGFVQIPRGGGTETKPVWTGTLDSAGLARLKALVYSPTVLSVIRSICSGDTAVWLILDSPDKKATRTFTKTLEKKLAALQKELKLPHELDPLDSAYDDDLAPGIPMKLEFSIQNVDLKAPETALLNACLSAWAPKLMSMEEPLAVPVFGRGRALAVFTPDELTDEVLAEVCQFLVGPCSCKVKALNPGFDLVMPFAWERALLDESYDVDAVIKSLATTGAESAKGK